MQTSNYEINWQDIESRLHKLQPVVGGFSQAQRGLIRLPDNRQVFVKCAVNDSTELWTRREVKVYDFLERQGFSHMPKLLVHKSDDTGFALEALLPEDGWSWKPEWDDARLQTTLKAMDNLAEIQPGTSDRVLLSEQALGEADNGWLILEQSSKLQDLLRQKLVDAGKGDVAAAIDFTQAAERSRQFVFSNDVLVHNDVRADNCAWHVESGQVKFVDWNWIQLGDRRIDLSGFLVHVHKSGFDVLPRHSHLLDREALHWMAGFWLYASVTPIWPGGPNDLRQHQLESGAVAWDLEGRLEAGA